MPGPVSNGVRQIPTGELTRSNIRSNGKTNATLSKSARRNINKHACAIRNGAGKFRGEHNCVHHPGKK